MRHSPLTNISLSLLTVFFITAAGAAEGDQDQVVTLIFTNDMESAYEPVPAWWRDDMESRCVCRRR